MPIELAMVLKAAASLPELVQATSKVVASIKGRWGNAAAKRALEANLHAIRGTLVHIDVLAKAAETYVGALEEMRRLDVDVLLIEQFVASNEEALGNRVSAAYESSWDSLGRLVDRFRDDSGIAIQAHLQRKEWYDAADDQMINSRLNDVNQAFARLVERVEARRVDPVKAAIEMLEKPIDEVRETLRTSAQRILAGLRELHRQESTLGVQGAP